MCHFEKCNQKLEKLAATQSQINVSSHNIFDCLATSLVTIHVCSEQLSLSLSVITNFFLFLLRKINLTLFSSSQRHTGEAAYINPSAPEPE